MICSGLAIAEPKLFTDQDLRQYNYPHTPLPQYQERSVENQGQNPGRTIKKQMAVRNFPQRYWSREKGFWDNNETRCLEYCAGASGADINTYLNAGWQIVSSRTIEISKKPLYEEGSYCRCVGTEYVLEGLFEK
jgi:hypothetical protein